MLISYSLLSLFFSYRFFSGCEVRGSCGPGAHLPVRPKDWPQDDDARGGPCCPWEATAAGVTSHPATATDPKAAPDCRISETAWELDTAAPGSASGAHQGSRCFLPLTFSLREPVSSLGHRKEHRGKVQCD